MRKLRRAICTSGEPVSPSVVAYSAMIFFFVAASVPIDMAAPSGSLVARRAGACSPGHSGSAAVTRRGSWSLRRPAGQPSEIITRSADVTQTAETPAAVGPGWHHANAMGTPRRTASAGAALPPRDQRRRRPSRRCLREHVRRLSRGSPREGRRPHRTATTRLTCRHSWPTARVIDKQPDVPGYDRDCGPGDGCVFGTEWSDDTDAPQGHNGCDTRNDVLAASLTTCSSSPGATTATSWPAGWSTPTPAPAWTTRPRARRSTSTTCSRSRLPGTSAPLLVARASRSLRQRHRPRAARRAGHRQPAEERQHPGQLAAAAHGLPLRLRRRLPRGRRLPTTWPSPPPTCA